MGIIMSIYTFFIVLNLLDTGYPLRFLKLEKPMYLKSGNSFINESKWKLAKRDTNDNGGRPDLTRKTSMTGHDTNGDDDYSGHETNRFIQTDKSSGHLRKSHKSRVKVFSDSDALAPVNASEQSI